MEGTDRRGGARDGGRIGRGEGESDGVERLAVLMSGDCGPALKQVVRLDGADSVNEGGGMFSWFDIGGVMGNGVLASLLDLLPPPSPFHSPSQRNSRTVMTRQARAPASDIPASEPPPFASADDLSVFDLTAILRSRWFLDRSHLASNVVSAQRGPNGDLDWVEFAPPFHTHLIKCATALLPPQLCSMKRLKGVLFAYVLEVLNSPASTLASFKRKTLSKKVCPWLDPAFKPPPPAGRGTAVSTTTVRGRPSPAAPSPAPISPVHAVGSVAMACDTPPPSSPTPSPRAQGSVPPASPAPRVPDEAALLARRMAGLAPTSSPSPSSSRAPSKRPASPLSPPQHPVPRARGSSGFSPSPAPFPRPSCSCHTQGWASCRVHLTWDSSPLRAHPHAFPSASPPFHYYLALSPDLNDRVSACADCSWDPPEAPDQRLHLCRTHFSAYASDPRPLPAGLDD